MRAAAKVVVLVGGAGDGGAGGGWAASMAASFGPLAGSGLARDAVRFELPLDKYGTPGAKASGDLINFVDSQGSPQVSIMVIPNYAPPIAACAMSEILAALSSGQTSSELVLIVPFITRSSTAHSKVEGTAGQGNVVALASAELGASSAFTKLLSNGTTILPSSLRVDVELLACLVLMARVLSIPTVFITASEGQLHTGISAVHILVEALNCIGNHLANHLHLDFSKATLAKNITDEPRNSHKPWREFYL